MPIAAGMEDASQRWAELELAPWVGVTIDRRHLEGELSRLAMTTPSISIVRIEQGSVVLEEAPGEDQPLFRDRAELYRRHLQDALALAAAPADGLLAIDVADRNAARLDVPLFRFQKRRGSNAILLPDVDLLALDFFEHPGFQDPLSFDRKRPEAVFVGSTTGGLLTADRIATRSHDRLRAALAFKDHPRVAFHLPSIVQCDTPATAALVKQLGVGGRELSWQEQFACRYLLSMDGNGATCARVALALRSHGVLVKYASPHLLHYFHGLEAWRHYIPVMRDEDVLAVVDGATACEARDRGIAERSQAFARTHLTREAVLRYTARLLEGYLALLGR